MTWLVKLMGIVMVSFGAVYLVKPSTMKKVMRFWVKDERLYLAAILGFLIGIIFLTSASRCTLPWVVILVGIISIVKAIAVVALGKKKIISMLEKLEKSSAKLLRIRAVLVLVLGILLIYSA